MKKVLALVLALVILSVVPAALANEKITIAASTTPHAIILEFVKDDLAALGYDLEILEVTDYYVANPATASGEVDGNYFQHIPFLNAYNASVEKEEDKLVAAFGVHCEPYGIYPGTKKDLKDIAPGDKIAVTNDPSNETRALILLADAGLITLPEGTNPDSGLQKEDIVEANGIEIVELDAEKIPAVLDDVAFAVINGNYASDNGLIPGRDAVYFEQPGSQAAEAYVNIFAVKPENAEADFVKALEKVVYTQKVYDLIVNSGFTPVFEVPAE